MLILAEITGHAAEAAAAHGDVAATGITKITQDFGINLPNIIAQVFNFAIVAFVLWRFAFKPVLATLDARQQKIAAGLKYAEDMKAQLAASQQESAALLKNAQVEANRVIDAARKTAKEIDERAQKEAVERANGIVTKAQQAIELEHKKMLAEARAEIARLVVSTTERVLAKKLSDADRASYNESAARELANV
ncbi:MAG: F0F1 ATP synthase subunit B [Nibricoccus sp.]